jgi:type IV pilus assembly protein PilM
MKLSEIAASLTHALNRSRPGPIGLDLGLERLSMVQLKKRGQATRVCAAASLGLEGKITSGRDLKRVMRQAFKLRAFRGRRVVTALPAGDVKLMVLNYELERGQDEPSVILSLVEERTGSLDERVVDYVSIRKLSEKEREHSALVAIAREEAVIAYLELLRSAGLKVEALEIAPIAVMAVAEDSRRENALVLHLGTRRSHLTVLWGRRLILYRELEFDQNEMIERVCGSLDMRPETAAHLLNQHGVAADRAADDAEVGHTLRQILQPYFGSVAEQAGNALVYTASRTRGESVDAVYLLGPIARWPGVDQLLHELLRIPVRILDPLEQLGGEPDVDPAPGTAPDLALAAGLALRGMEGP